MSLKRTIGAALPLSVRRRMRQVAGAPRPWDPHVHLAPPPCPAGLVTGPPDFVGLGAQKAGTSWWFWLVNEHPQVHRVEGTEKELHYFARFADTEFSDADAAEYRRWFPRPPGQLVGEWTPRYLHQFWVPPLLARAAPDARFLVLLRDPIERYRSGLAHVRQRGGRVDVAVAEDAFERGCYGRQLSQLFDHVPRDRVLVLQYERCRADASSELSRTYRFLGVDDTFRPGVLDRPVNVSKSEKPALPAHVLAGLRGAYAQDLELLCRLVPDLDVSLWPNFRTP